MPLNFPGHVKISTAGGILTILIANINAADILKTILLGIIGTVISFFTSALLKYWFSRWFK